MSFIRRSSCKEQIMNKKKRRLPSIWVAYTGSGLVTAGSSPGKEKKKGGSAGRQLHERIDHRGQRFRSSRVQLMPSETARFYFPWGIFGAKQTACTVILLKVNTFLPTPSPLSMEEVFRYIRVLSYPYIRHRYTVAHRLTALYTFSVRDHFGIGRIL